MRTRSIQLWTAFAMLVICLVFGSPFLLQLSRGIPVKADAIVILGGGEGDRLVKASELYLIGYARQFVLTGQTHKMGSSGEDMLDHRGHELIDRYGVPLSRIFYVEDSTNTWREAQQTLMLMKRSKWQKVIVVSDPPHMLRLYYVWGKLFRNRSESFVLVATEPSWWVPWKWWSNSTSFNFVCSELVKLPYYIFVH